MRKFFKLSIIAFFTSLLISCDIFYHPSTETRDYKDYEEFVLNIDDFYNANESAYFIYCYRYDCSDCVPIKGDILDYIDKFKENKVETKLYLMEFHKIDTDEGRLERAKFKTKPENYSGSNSQIKKLTKEMLGSTKLEETYFFGTPTLYKIEENTLKNVVVGNTNIKSVI